MVFDRLSTWLIAAFNGEFLRWEGMRPKEQEGLYDPSEESDADTDRKRSVEGRGRKMLRRGLEALGENIIVL